MAFGHSGYSEAPFSSQAGQVFTATGDASGVASVLASGVSVATSGTSNVSGSVTTSTTASSIVDVSRAHTGVIIQGSGPPNYNRSVFGLVLAHGGNSFIGVLYNSVLIDRIREGSGDSTASANTIAVGKDISSVSDTAAQISAASSVTTSESFIRDIVNVESSFVTATSSADSQNEAIHDVSVGAGNATATATVIGSSIEVANVTSSIDGVAQTTNTSDPVIVHAGSGQASASSTITTLSDSVEIVQDVGQNNVIASAVTLIAFASVEDVSNAEDSIVTGTSAVSGSAVRVSIVEEDEAEVEASAQTIASASARFVSTGQVSASSATSVTEESLDLLAIQRNLSITSNATVVGVAQDISTGAGVIDATASTSAVGIRRPFFDSTLYNRGRAVYVLEEQSRKVFAENESANVVSISTAPFRTVSVELDTMRKIYVETPEYRNVKVAA